MGNQIKSNRIGWVDIARGITIILMVMGHTSIPASLSKWIWSFHMPLFFFVSGLFFYAEIDFRKLLLKRLYTLVIPYVFFSLIVYLGYSDTEYQKPDELLYGWGGYALWFVPVLFFSELVFCLLVRLKQVRIIIPVLLVLTAMGYFMSVMSISLPLKINVVPFATFFMAFGFFFKHWIFHYKPSYLLTTVIGIVTVALSQMLPKLDMAQNDFGFLMPNLFNALLGIFFIFSVSIYLAKGNNIGVKCLKWFGRNSLFVMAFSQLFNYWIFTGLQTIGLPQIVALPLRYLILFTSIYIIAKILTSCLPFLVGRNYKKYVTK